MSKEQFISILDAHENKNVEVRKSSILALYDMSYESQETPDLYTRSDVKILKAKQSLYSTHPVYDERVEYNLYQKKKFKTIVLTRVELISRISFCTNLSIAEIKKLIDE